MVRCRPFTHAAPTREADLPVKFHAKNTPALPANRKGQSGKVLLCPQQDNLATSVAHFCIAVLTLMVRLFEAVKANPGMRAAEAQQAAMLSVMNDPDHPQWANPAYWAPFILVGEPR